jgi:NADH-quinone oxidoreductase subunit C
VTASEVLDSLRARYPDAAARPPDTAISADVPPEGVRAHLLYLRDTLHFDFLVFLTALDWPARAEIELVYRLFSYESKVSCVLRAHLPREGARVETASDLYRTAEWHERETAEMFGVQFIGHPDPRKLLLPDDLEGHPLRKDFSHPNMIRLPEVE